MLNSICSIFITIPVYLIFLIINIRKETPLSRQILWFLFFCYITAVIAVTLFPFPYDKELINMNKEFQYLKNNFVPFKGMYILIKNDSLTIIVRNILGNVILAMPLGFLIPLLCYKPQNIKRIFFIGIGFSLIIEMSQFLLSLYLGYTYKITDVDDLILNTIGALLGYISYKLFCIIKSQ